jgi:membrane protein DedA with SNARE-associated domain
MNETVHFLARYGYWLLVGAVLARQAFLPIPAGAILVAAGALARSGRLSLSGIVGLSVLTFLFADLAWYEAGRQFGDRILHFLCGLTRDPGACVHRATDVFSRHGVRTLLISKFVVGLAAVAVPLTGGARTAPLRFVVFEALVAMLWSAAYPALGCVFSNQLDRVAFTGANGTVAALAVRRNRGFLRSAQLAL